MTTTDERRDLSQVAESSGWARRDLDRVDVYQRGNDRIRVIWQGSNAISGASRFQDDIMGTYTRDLATVSNWLTR
ncbi:hypothetical protein [Mycolicibacterium brisbanense]|uniref:Uncharacterized protein n=1 Tax=Mycolicibacterium brisbanense TaxID=146020 RepID=A0A124DZH0_9MYCO|nr:hypothetical protein [Mycolicibacterium brisbanense]MCV7162219.1 hypothetical protein [Mycolicibacterium brisbanense]GAS87333.1 hypothetical protein RMCB_1429 [Mycolicibacterium brisbanense]